jgi:uncharacterized protein (DUF1330 family)
MPAYVISDVHVIDPEAMARYCQLAPVSIGKYDGRYLIRSGPFETLEGEWTPEAIVVVEFPTMERAREWYSSAEYAEARQLSEIASVRRLILVEGVGLSR